MAQATEKQINFILKLINEGPGPANPAPEGPTTEEGLSQLTVKEASALIDAWKRAQGPSIATQEREAERMRSIIANIDNPSEPEDYTPQPLVSRRGPCKPDCTRRHKHR